MRLQKFLSQAGVASRRKAEEWIALERISVNGQVVTKPGTVVDAEEDAVAVDGKRVTPQKNVYIVLHKPSGYLCSLSDPFGRPIITDLIRDIPQRIYHVGRLDLNSEGLLILTNDGAFSQLLTHPRHQIDKIYQVKLQSPLSKKMVAQLNRGVKLDDGYKTAPARVEVLPGDGHRAEITIREGKKRQVKRMLRAVNNRVIYLKRVAVGPLRLENLPRGKWRNLTPGEIATLKNAAENEL
ncbi:MAG: pseudouridine synthase [Candidatus Auribacterota bacterium]|nr:pseudouridine synthase [Candidatus Auribacterota bacterium]